MSDEIEAENKRLRKALRWYAKRARYEAHHCSIVDESGGDIILRHPDLYDDQGERAREALKRPRPRRS